MSAAIFQFGEEYRVNRKQRPSRMTWVSSGMMSRDGDTSVHVPKSMASCRTIQRRNRLRRLQAPPDEGREKKYATPGFGRRRP